MINDGRIRKLYYLFNVLNEDNYPGSFVCNTCEKTITSCLHTQEYIAQCIINLFIDFEWPPLEPDFSKSVQGIMWCFFDPNSKNDEIVNRLKKLSESAVIKYSYTINIEETVKEVTKIQKLAEKKKDYISFFAASCFIFDIYAIYSLISKNIFSKELICELLKKIPGYELLLEQINVLYL